MPFTLWVLLLTVAGVVVVLARRFGQRRAHSARRHAASRQSAAEQTELDRRDCKALEESLRSGAYGDASRPKTPAGSDAGGSS